MCPSPPDRSWRLDHKLAPLTTPVPIFNDAIRPVLRATIHQLANPAVAARRWSGFMGAGKETGTDREHLLQVSYTPGARRSLSERIGFSKQCQLTAATAIVVRDFRMPSV